MDELQRPFLVAALALFVLVLLIEVGSPLASGGTRALGEVGSMAGNLLDDFPNVDPEDIDFADPTEPPGRGIIAMALLDLVVAFRIGLMGLALVVPPRVLGRAQGIATFIFSLILLLVGIFVLIFLVIELTVMVSLFVASPFGTLAYLALWGAFPRGDAAALLSLLLLLKVIGVICLVIAQYRFLQIKSLVLLLATSLVANVVLAFLHGIAPNPITSIADQIGAIIVVILGLIWVVLTMIGSIWGVVGALRVDRALAR